MNRLRSEEKKGDLVDERGGLVHGVDEDADEAVDDHLVLVVVAHLEGVVEEDVRLQFVVVGIDDVQVLLRQPPRALILLPNNESELLHSNVYLYHYSINI